MPKHEQTAFTTCGRTAITTPVTSNPELVFLSTPRSSHIGDQINEFRVYNYRTLASGRTVRSDGWSLVDLLLILGMLWWSIHVSWHIPKQGLMEWDLISWAIKEWPILALYTSLLLFIRHKSTTILFQTVTPLPSLGLQLSTVRGLSFPSSLSSNEHDRLLVPLSTSQTFIPLSEISTIVINEGLSRWSVRYYLAVIKTGGKGVVVAFSDVRPRHPVLREVYHGLREILFDEWGEDNGLVEG